MTFAVGIDLGTSSMKGVVVDGDGRVVARARAGYATSRPQPEAAEQRPADWERALAKVVSTLAAKVPARRWDGVGLSGMIPSLVLHDGHGEVLGPALTWEDARAERHAVAARRRLGARRLYGATGQWVDGRYALPMWAWTRERRPELADRATHVLGAKDHLLRWVTGELATDPSTATGFGCFSLATGRWDGEIASAFGLDESMLPTIVPSAETFAHGREAARALGVPRGLPIAVGAADSMVSADVLGIVASGEIGYIAGTSTVILAFGDRFEPDPRHRYLVSPASRPGRFAREMDLLATGSAVAWCASLLGLERGGASLVSLAERARDDTALTFLPYVAPGEQGALWDPDVRGAIVGLTLRDGPAEIARALLDGVVLESRRCVDVLRSRGASATIRATGTLVRSAWFRQRLADATGCEVALSNVPGSAAALGAAAVVIPAIGVVATTGAPTVPNAAESRVWDERWRLHEDARSRMSRPQ
jgi:sugar (pentulose or hexulose) kinase